ncbi:MAG: GtrA family protein [Acholeplasmatales bacterium]|nr:GtrA family protein [Acholeplasmatales bacterium]
MIKKLWRWGVKKFWNRKFITFCVIGVLNTLIHIGTLWCMYKIFSAANILQEESMETWKVLISNAVAFIVASTFSYFANNYITFRNKKSDAKTFWESMFIFAARFGLTELLTFIFVSIFKAMHLGDIWIDYVGPFTASIIMIPVAYVFLALVLDHSKDEEKKEETKEENAIDIVEEEKVEEKVENEAN